MGFPKKCVEEFGTFVHLERYSSTSLLDTRYINKVEVVPVYIKSKEISNYILRECV